MRNDYYLVQGWPIATGVIEGTCHHLVKDRMEQSGMRWTQLGAQAVLDLRAVRINRQRQHQRLCGVDSPIVPSAEEIVLEQAA